ncbi:hypothetical protein C0Q70_15170 [Pomacea canaliculata]|uniref:Probable imidazolonepropionase n=1 Tax=Pomacea canaliculata TaxID=400727 RepID=A0A2T7NU54_POMCA|nr:hypothetical protein C0Q70_15170 [Pomacea canaliculata]
MLRSGTTLVEVKSGYGLDTDSEVKMLRVIERARRSLPIDISCTFCGAHAVPRDITPEEATRRVLQEQLPRIQALTSVGELHVHNIDVFCEEGVFSVQQSREILLAGKAAGLNINFHGEELHRLNSAEMGAEIGALAISHLEEVSEEGMRAMARAAKEFPLVMNLACVTLRMSMPEVLVAATLNAAAALGRSDMHGSLEIGKLANFLILDNPRWEHLIYQMGDHNSVIKHVVWHGDIVHSTPSIDES